MPIRKKYRKQSLIIKRKKRVTRLRGLGLSLPKLSLKKKKAVNKLYNENKNNKKRLIKKSIAPSLLGKFKKFFIGGGKKNKKKFKKTFKTAFRLTAILAVVGLNGIIGIFRYFS